MLSSSLAPQQIKTTILKSFPKLYATAKTGKVKSYESQVIQETETKKPNRPKIEKIFIVRFHGYVTGKLTENKKEITAGKNIGKANETSIADQAISDAQSMWDKKVKEGYVEDINKIEQDDLVLPMLAKDYTKQKHHIVFPARVQPKIDGVRCTCKEEGDYILFKSRASNDFLTLDYLIPEVGKLLDLLPKGTILDGEIYNEDVPFEEMTGSLRRERPTRKVTTYYYYIFDIITKDKELTFDERTDLLNVAFTKLKLKETIQPDSLHALAKGHLVLVETKALINETEIQTYHDKYVQDYYFEGAIIRNAQSKYLQNYRSKDLQKYKEFLEDEFLIVGAKSGEGLEQDCAIFICQMANGKVFEARPKGSRELRKEWLKNIETIKGQMLTVKYQNLTTDGIPRFPVGKCLRNYE